jgi:hypothetical protein
MHRLFSLELIVQHSRLKTKTKQSKPNLGARSDPRDKIQRLIVPCALLSIKTPTSFQRFRTSGGGGSPFSVAYGSWGGSFVAVIVNR